MTPEAQKRIAAKREFLAALLQGTSGGRPGPLSPRRAERSPAYNLIDQSRRRPEDHGGPNHFVSCLLPSPEHSEVASDTLGSVAIYYDISRGQGFSRSSP